MSKIEREMIAEARAARQKQEAADIGADIPSAPNDEQDSGVPFYSDEIIGHLLRGGDD
jgi:hypothetical protein